MAPSANPIVPRWEWRCFAHALAAVAQSAAIPADAKPRESDEIYLLDMRGPQNAKIRDDVLDIKILHQTDADGLELWEPVFKASFPLSAADVAAAFVVWELPPTALPRANYTIGQFLDEVVPLQTDLRVVRVHKSRRGFTFAGCIAELAKLTVDATTIDSFSLEHENPATVVAAVRKLGLDPKGNTNYPLGLKRLLGLEGRGG